MAHEAHSPFGGAALNRPNAMFRDEIVRFYRCVEGKDKYAVRREEKIMRLPAVEEMAAPKDLWLAERCLAERREGRKSLVFVRQTGKRDIQPHIAEILKEHGLGVGVLSPSVSPRSRVAWIQRYAPAIDVLLTNARLVKVGLNLRMFATGIFYEFEWSLAILWQAMRRVYRPGAPLPVRILFPAYENTLEKRALSLIGQKMKATSIFSGDEVASVLTEEDESDFRLFEQLCGQPQAHKILSLKGSKLGRPKAMRFIKQILQLTPSTISHKLRNL